eukprot:TRINITY_DN3320_c0_g2_i1.p1 TRINITY_DN3320_c0_g2~~TRINITY_DN3320_c0_g2_i1.p1  ORF type:complete len:122 (+),score=10.61 TRINITY_DN3320_c0_g2_i1:327-692(+)
MIRFVQQVFDIQIKSSSHASTQVNESWIGYREIYFFGLIGVDGVLRTIHTTINCVLGPTEGEPLPTPPSRVQRVGVVNNFTTLLIAVKPHKVSMKSGRRDASFCLQLSWLIVVGNVRSQVS